MADDSGVAPAHSFKVCLGLYLLYSWYSSEAIPDESPKLLLPEGLDEVCFRQFKNKSQEKVSSPAGSTRQQTITSEKLCTEKDPHPKEHRQNQIHFLPHGGWGRVLIILVAWHGSSPPFGLVILVKKKKKWGGPC